MPIQPEHVRALIEAGIRAPSADNRHHVLFETTSEGLRVWADEAYRSTEPHRQILTQISVGMILESIDIKASSNGYIADWTYKPAPQILAEARLQSCERSAGDLASCIEARHTNRRFYSRRKAPQEALAQMQLDAQPHADLLWLEGAQRASALRLIRVAETERFRRRYLHEELFSGVRFDVGWREGCEEGLAPASLEVEPGMRAAFKLLRHWPLMNALTKVGAHKMLGLRAGYLPCSLSPHLGIVHTAASPELSAMLVGRAFQRIWLRATALGLAMQPLAASVILPYQSERSNGISDEAREILRAGWRDIVGSTRCPLMLFRMGYASAPTAVSGRRPIEHYLMPSGSRA